MATQQRQHGLISDEYGFLVGSRRLEQGIESVDDKVQRIIEFLEKNAKPVRVVNSQTVAQNQVAKDVSKLVTLTEKSHKEIQKTKVANSQTLRNGGNIKNRQADENSNLSTRPTRTVNSQTSQQAQDRQRDANGRFVGGDGEQSKSSGGLFKGMTQAVRNGFLQANIDGQNLDPSIDALYEVKNILSPVGRVAGLMLRPLGALFKSKKRNEPLSREEEKHNKKEIKLLERIARMGGGGGGLLGGLLGRGGGLLRMVALPILALAGAFFGGFKIGQIINEKVGGWINTLIEADIPKKISEAWNGFITKLSELIPDVLKKAFEATPFGAAQKGGSKLLEWGRGVANTVKSTMLEAYNDTVGDSGQSSGGSQPKSLDGKPLNVAVYDAYRKQGLSHHQALAITGEVGRENDFDAKTIFGKHTDPAKDGKGQSITNMGMLSWNRERADALQAHLKKRGVLDEKGNMIKGQAALDAQAEFAVSEMKSGKYKNRLSHFWNNPDANPESFAKELGKDYVGWAYGQKTIKGKNGTRVPFDHQSHSAKVNGYVAKTANDVQKKQAVTSYAQNAEVPTATPVATPQKTGTPKATALPPTISKPPVVPSLSMKPTINMKAQPIQFRSAAKVEAIPKIETVPEMHTSPKPMLVQSVNSGDNISQNLSDRGLAHLVTGGLGENRYGA